MRLAVAIDATVATVAIVATTHAVHADDALVTARALQGQLEFDRALSIVEAALAAGDGTTPARTAELHVVAGTLAAGLDRPDAAQRHFAIALAIAPATQLPPGTSPKIVAPFDAARTTTAALAIAARVERGTAALVVAHDPLHLVAGIAVELDVGGPTIARAAMQLPVERGHARAIAALDRDGNRVWFERVVPDVTVDGPLHHRAPSPIARWSTWTVATVAIGAAGGVFAWRARVAQDDWNTLRADDGNHDYAQLRAVENRGRRDAIIADVGFGLAGACAIAAVVLFATRDGDREAPRITLGAGSIGVVGRF